MDSIDLVLTYQSELYTIRIHDGALSEVVLASLIKMVDEITKAFILEKGKPDTVEMIECTAEFGQKAWQFYNQSQIESLSLVAKLLEFEPQMQVRRQWVKMQIRRNHPRRN